MKAAALRMPTPEPVNSRLWVAIGISVAVHAALLILHFNFPDASRAMQEKALDIILVNAKSSRKPVDAQAQAQANLDGGGNTDENRMVSTPLPPTLQQTTGDEVEQAQRRIKQAEALQQQLLTEVKSKHTTAANRSGQEQPEPASVSGFDLADSAKAMARLEGQVSKDVDEYNKRPRKKFLGARTEEAALAPYLDAWKQKVERVGALNYPEAARGKIYGSVVVTVELNVRDGSIRSAEVTRSSGHKILDEAALRILQRAAPFGPVPRSGLTDETVLVFIRTWQFTQGDALNTSVAR